MSLTVEKCLQAWTNSLRQMNAKADIVFFGDSLTYYGDFSTMFPDKVVCNLGLRGDTIQGMIDRVEQLSIVKPAIIFMMAGINDVASCSLKQFEERYCALVESVRRTVPTAELVLQSLLPVNTSYHSISCTNQQIVFCNNVISHLSTIYNTRYINLYTIYEKDGELPLEMTSDGIHILPSFYNLWLRSITF